MTVISTLVTTHCTVHASDSLLSIPQPDGTYKYVEWQRPKIVKVEKWRGAASYWGLAKASTYKWCAYDWLRGMANQGAVHSSPEEFADAVAHGLNRTLSRLREPVDPGIGIHFTAYERIQGYWIPELFLITNYTDPWYGCVNPAGVRVSRETYHQLTNEDPRPEHREDEYRLRVHNALQNGLIFIYNNGDPEMFNPVAGAMFNALRIARTRGKLRDVSDIKTCIAIARTPVAVVSAIQRDFFQSNTRIVGGKVHDLAITPTGSYQSNSGDA